MVIYGKNFQKKIDSLQGTVNSVLQKFKKREEISLFSAQCTSMRKNGPKVITARITLPNGKEASIDFKPESEFDFDSVSERIKYFIKIKTEK